MELSKSTLNTWLVLIVKNDWEWFLQRQNYKKRKNIQEPPLREKCPYSEFFWSAFSRIRTENGDILRMSPFSVRIWEMRTKKTPNTDTFHAVESGLVS